jgi:hypothetical protein
MRESKRNAEAAIIRIRNDILIEKYAFTKPKKPILFENLTKDYFELHSREKNPGRKTDSTSKDLNHSLMENFFLR